MDILKNLDGKQFNIGYLCTKRQNEKDLCYKFGMLLDSPNLVEELKRHGLNRSQYYS